MRKALIGFALLLATVAAYAQSGIGQLPAWGVQGNPTASAAQAQSATITQLLDGAFCSTQGAILQRLVSVWACPPTTLPSNLLFSATAPTINSCGGGSPSISANNGTAAFRVTVGTTVGTCVVNLPTATTGWNCFATDITTNSTTVFLTKQTASTSTTATLANFNDVAVGANWTNGDVLAVSCFAF